MTKALAMLLREAWVLDDPARLARSMPGRLRRNEESRFYHRREKGTPRLLPPGATHVNVNIKTKEAPFVGAPGTVGNGPDAARRAVRLALKAARALS